MPRGDACEIDRLTLENKTTAPRTLDVFSYVEFCLWDAMDDSSNFQRNFSTGEVEVVESAIYHKTEYRERRDHYAVFWANAPVTSFDTSRDAFCGVYGGPAAPEAVKAGHCSNSIAHGWAPVGAHHFHLTLAPGEKKSIIFGLGYIENPVREKFSAPGIINKARAEAMMARYATDAQVDAARRAGIANISLDLMLAVEWQDAAAVCRSASLCRELGAEHVSAYLLKIEENTPFGRRRDALALPDEDEAASLYLTACETLEEHGFRQYEISNFAYPGRESRHNLKYWTGAPYLGIGPAAHSCVGGQRFAYPRDLAAFLAGRDPRPEAEGKIRAESPEEYLLLRLRLTEGLTERAYTARFGTSIPKIWRDRAASLPPRLIACDAQGIRLTREGFLVSNVILAELL